MFKFKYLCFTSKKQVYQHISLPQYRALSGGAPDCSLEGDTEGIILIIKREKRHKLWINNIYYEA